MKASEVTAQEVANRLYAWQCSHSTMNFTAEIEFILNQQKIIEAQQKVVDAAMVVTKALWISVDPAMDRLIRVIKELEDK